MLNYLTILNLTFQKINQMNYSRIIKRLLVALFIVISTLINPVSSETEIDNKSVKLKEPSNSLRIKIVPGNWGKSELPDVYSVCLSAANTIWKNIDGKTIDPILIHNSKLGPIVFFQHGNNKEYLVHLNTKDRRWAQCAFQFAHEFCHIICNYRKVKNKQMWFEETICECASLFAIKRMAIEWKKKPPYPIWSDYYKSLESYSEALLNTVEGKYKFSIRDYYQKNLLTFEKNPNDRERNRWIAIELLSLFENSPESWQAVRYLNLGPTTDNNNLKSYLSGWHSRVPEKHKTFVTKIAEVFGIKI